MRHKWERVTEDLRRSILEPRRLIHRCSQCGLHRAFLSERGLRGQSWYGQPYVGEWRREAGECPNQEDDDAEG